MRTRVVLAIVTSCAPLALAACPQFESDFIVGSSTADATSGDDGMTNTPDGTADVGDTGALDVSAADVLPEGFAEGSVDGGADVSTSDAQEESPAPLCCSTQAGAPDCPSPPAVYPCNGLASSPGAMCATDGGTITIGSSGGPNQGSAPCWALGGDSGTWAQCEFGQTACCGATTVEVCP